MSQSWSKLNHLQIGKYGEYFSKMAFTREGFDVYTSEVDDKGIDFVIRRNEKEFFDVQVKSIRNNNYVFMRKEVFRPRKNLFLSLLLFDNNDDLPTLLLVPSLDWIEKKHSALIERNYENSKSNPEWGLSLNKANIENFKSNYAFKKQIEKL